jgi:integrase
LTQPAIEAIEGFLPLREHPDSSFLMTKSNGKPMDRNGILTRIYKLGRKAKIPVSPHALRRAFVTINANKGRPLPMLQIACGHSNITTTRSYCMTTEDETIETMSAWD